MEIEEIYKLYKECEGLCLSQYSCRPGQMCIIRTSANADRFAEVALARGAKYVIAPSSCHTKGVIRVADPNRLALELARYHKQSLPNLKVIAVTGSCGKTSTKVLLESVLGTKYNVIGTLKNHNSYMGCAMRILACNETTDFAVLEMGIVNQTVMEKYCLATDPDFAIITKIGKAHLRGFGGEEGVKIGKGRLYKYVAEKGGTVFLNTDDRILVELAKTYGVKKKTTVPYSRSISKVEIFPADSDNPYLKVNIPGLGDIQTNFVGEYNTDNVLAAIAVGKHFGVSDGDIVKGIGACKPEWLRSQILDWKGLTVVLDTFNSNPTSCFTSLRCFADTYKDKRKAVILGDMQELGEWSDGLHRELIDLVDSLGIETAYLVGPELLKTNDGKGKAKKYYFSRVMQLAEFLKENPVAEDVALVKGSRRIGLERVFKV